MQLSAHQRLVTFPFIHSHRDISNDGNQQLCTWVLHPLSHWGAWDSFLSGPEGKRTDDTLKSEAWRLSQSRPLTEFLAAQTWKQLRHPSVGKWIHKPCPIMRCGVTQHWKETSYPAMKGHGGALAYHQAKEANLKERHVIPTIWYLEKVKLWRLKRWVVSRGWRGKRRIGEAQRIFTAENTLHTAMMHRCDYTCVQTHRMYTPKSDPNVNYRLWAIMCQCSFSCNTCTTLVGGCW